MSRNDLALVEDLVRWLGNVRCLSITGYFSGSQQIRSAHQGNRGDDDPAYFYETWALIGLVTRHMRRLEFLHCTDYYTSEGHGCKTSDFIQYIDIPSLKGLEIGGLAKSAGPPITEKVVQFSNAFS